MITAHLRRRLRARLRGRTDVLPPSALVFVSLNLHHSDKPPHHPDGLKITTPRYGSMDPEHASIAGRFGWSNRARRCLHRIPISRRAKARPPGTKVYSRPERVPSLGSDTERTFCTSQGGSRLRKNLRASATDTVSAGNLKQLPDFYYVRIIIKNRTIPPVFQRRYRRGLEPTKRPGQGPTASI